MKPILIGVTGNAGGGKSTFIDILEKLGLSTIKADDIAKEVIYTPKNYSTLLEIFGTSVLGENKQIDLKKVAALFFDLSEKGKRVRGLMHQHFREIIWNEVKRQAEARNRFLVFIENAVLFEGDWKEHFNYIICVYCSDEEARRRIKASRPNWSEERIEAVMKIQLPIEEKIRLSNLPFDTTNITLGNMEMPIKAILKRMKLRI